MPNGRFDQCEHIVVTWARPADRYLRVMRTTTLGTVVKDRTTWTRFFIIIVYKTHCRGWSHTKEFHAYFLGWYNNYRVRRTPVARFAAYTSIFFVWCSARLESRLADLWSFASSDRNARANKRCRNHVTTSLMFRQRIIIYYYHHNAACGAKRPRTRARHRLLCCKNVFKYII